MTNQPGYPIPPVVPAVDEDLAATDPDRMPEDPHEGDPTLVTTPDHLERGVQDERHLDDAPVDDRLMGDDRVVDLDGDEA